MRTVPGPARTPDIEAIWSEFRGRLRAFILRRVRDPDDAEDLLQEVMLRIHRHIGELDQASALSGWVFTIARNAIIDDRRRASRREYPVGLAPVDAATPEASDDIPDMRAEIGHCVAPLLGSIPPGYADALTLTEVKGLTQVEAARAAGISVSGMKSRVQRGRKELRRLLLECCEVERDRRGAVINATPRGKDCVCPPAPVGVSETRTAP